MRVMRRTNRCIDVWPTKIGVWSRTMKNSIYCALMSVLIGVVLGAIVGGLFDILFPDIALDPVLFVAFFTVVAWAILSALSRSKSAS
jgi:uncharacterized membrane protein YoaK (UPF0700 family)